MMDREQILEDLKMFVFRNKDSVLLQELESKLKAADPDNIDLAVYTTVYNKAKLVYDSARYYNDFLVDTFMDIDYSLEATEGYLDYSAEELLAILKVQDLVKSL